MPDVFEVADLLVSHAVDAYGQEIDIIAYSGSYAQGTATSGSDLDIFYIPSEGKRPPVGRTFRLDGILFDFWGIPWERMARFADGTFRGWSVAPSFVHHAKILHGRSAKQSERLLALKQTILDLQKPEARGGMLRRALDTFQSVAAHIGNLRLCVADGDIADARHSGWKVIASVWECLALANQVLLDRGLGHIAEQVPMLPERPKEMEDLIAIISTSGEASEISAAAERLAVETRSILRDFQRGLAPTSQDADFSEINYPELRDMVDATLSACRQNRPVASSAAAWFLQTDLSEMLHNATTGPAHRGFNLYSEFSQEYDALGLPNLMSIPVGEPAELAASTRLLDDRIRQWFTGRTASLEEFESLEEFKRSL